MMKYSNLYYFIYVYIITIFGVYVIGFLIGLVNGLSSPCDGWEKLLMSELLRLLCMMPAK